VKQETWNVDTSRKIITPEDLVKDPDRFGGAGMLMAKAAREGVFTIPLHSVDTASHVSLMTSDKEAVERILREGAVTIHSEGYWVSLLSQKIRVCFLNTEQLVPMWDNPMV